MNWGAGSMLRVCPDATSPAPGPSGYGRIGRVAYAASISGCFILTT
jgi:hypothetical protein